MELESQTIRVILFETYLPHKVRNFSYRQVSDYYHDSFVLLHQILIHLHRFPDSDIAFHSSLAVLLVSYRLTLCQTNRAAVCSWADNLGS